MTNWAGASPAAITRLGRSSHTPLKACAVGEWAVVFVTVSVLGWALVQRRTSSTAVTGPIVFVALGLLVG